MMHFFASKKSAISLVSVDLGMVTVQIPLAVIQGDMGGPTLLITAGNDGDEYAGIAAAYRIIEQFSHTSFFGTLIVIPIVNIPGFEAEKSQNPLDGIYPKHVYPGKKDGSPTERLRYWLSGYVAKSDLWMDLHGGSLTEYVNPYVHVWEKTFSHIRKLEEYIIEKISIPNVVCDTRQSNTRCGYVMCESNSVTDHIELVHAVMSVLGMTQEKTKKNKKHIFSHIHEYTLRQKGVWFSNFPPDNNVNKGFELGEVRSLDGKVLEKITAKQNGVLLWGKEGMSAHRGDVIAGVGY